MNNITHDHIAAVIKVNSAKYVFKHYKNVLKNSDNLTDRKEAAIYIMFLKCKWKITISPKSILANNKGIINEFGNDILLLMANIYFSAGYFNLNDKFIKAYSITVEQPKKGRLLSADNNRRLFNTILFIIYFFIIYDITTIFIDMKLKLISS